MNIFVLDECPIISAQMQCDKHVVKMPLETAQMLCSVWHRYGLGDKVPYREAHKNHPCTLWAGDSAENYEWLWHHGMELCFEYTRRYNKIHKCQQVIMDLDKVHATMFPVDTNGILDTETDFQSEVDEFVKEGRDFFEILSMSIHLLSTDKYKELSELNDEYTENSVYDLVNEAWNRYYE